MTTTPNDGGPAFPVFPDTRTWHASAFTGMTLRDYFAAKAMQGMFAADTEESLMPIKRKAAEAYAMADAMLSERDK